MDIVGTKNNGDIWIALDEFLRHSFFLHHAAADG